MDIDIDFADRERVLKLIKHVPAAINRKDGWVKHNTGVFVITPKAVGALSQPPIGLFPNHFAEQTWMNLQLHLWSTSTCNLDPAYNCMTSVEEHFGLDRHKDANIIHYAGQSADMNKLIETIKADDAKLKELGR